MRHSSATFRTGLRWTLLAAGSVFTIVSIHLMNQIQIDYDGESKLFLSNWSATQNKDDWSYPFVHIVNTRFMQHQGHLTDLARARLLLFKTFCLNTIIGQSILQVGSDPPPFLWIIKIDPELSPVIRDDFIALVEPYPFVYLVASNVNYGVGINPGGWRGGEAGDNVFKSKIYTGDIDFLRRAHAVREKRAILETRLDADDGLHVNYLESIQNEARNLILGPSNATNTTAQKWMYWCPLNRMEWIPTPPFMSSNGTEYGIFVPHSSPKDCVTAGISLGMSVGQIESDTPRFMHQTLYHELRLKVHHPDCGAEICVKMLDMPVVGAIRSRTPTSAGMKGVAKDEVDFERESRRAVRTSHMELPQMLQHGFHMDLSEIKVVNQYVRENVVAIVTDNLRGQCTRGHSCKNTTQAALQEFLDRAKKIPKS